MSSAEPIDYNNRQHRVYATGRALSEESARAWTDAFRRNLNDDVARSRALSILDVGSGTGRFSLLLAETLDAEVVGVEPSERMRDVAMRSSTHPRVRYVEGKAEHLPLADASFDAALLSDVLHHVRDKNTCVAELARVLRPDGVAFVRGVRPERFNEMINHRYFPGADELAIKDAVTTDQISDLFAVAGFDLRAHEIVNQQTAASLSEYAERIALRAISYLEMLDDADFEKGLADLRADAAKEVTPQPVIEGIDLLVFQRP